MGEYCENCGAKLSEQEGYSEGLSSFTCTQCGYVNGESRVTVVEPVKKKRKREKNEKTGSFMKRHWKKIAAAVIVIAAVSAVIMSVSAGIDAVKKLQRTGISSEECIGVSFEEVRQNFEAAGFTEVSVKPLADLKADELDMEGQTASVCIGKKTEFGKARLVRSDAPVVISYHSAKILNAPCASRNVKNMTHTSIEKAFTDAGFTDIEVKQVYGMWGKEGRVLSVTVGGDRQWKKGDEYRVDARVYIAYRTRNK